MSSESVTEQCTQADAIAYLEKRLSRSVRLSALNLLARREHGRHELIDKLRKRSARDIGTVIESMDFHQYSTITDEQWACWAENAYDRVLMMTVDQLVEDGLQCDHRFVSAYAKRRANAGFGPHRVLLELRSKGVDVDNGFDLGANWRQVLETVAIKKSGDPKDLGVKEKAALVRFLRYKGFAVGDINQLFTD